MAERDRRGEEAGAGKQSDQTSSDLDQTSSDLDQTLSDLDQTAADADQEASDTDQRQSAADQRASDRDQDAADREHLIRAGRDGDADVAYRTSSADREKSTQERSTGTFDRLNSASDRHENAARRDEIGRMRDLDSESRDLAAEARDRQAEEFEELLGARAGNSGVRREAAKDRRRAAEDRVAAAADREQAARDRDCALAELQNAQLDGLTGVYRRELGIAVLQNELDRARRGDGRLVLAHVDVDGIEETTDGHGQDDGDALLTAAVAAIQSGLRSYDPVVRFGDEFVCALTATDLDTARHRFAAIQSRFALSGRDRGLSVGMAALRPDDNFETLMERRDADLTVERSR